jgi:hypothetical protein
MALVLKTAPLVDPLDLDAVKLHLRVETDDEDTLITSYIKAAKEYCEGFQSETSGTFTIANTGTSATIYHGLGITPNINKVVLTQQNSPTNACKYYVSAVAATTFTVTTNDPGASGLTLGWSYRN